MNAIPAGTRFRLDPTLDLDELNMSPMVRMMARAVQRYGMVVRDGGGAVAFYGEDPTPTDRNPYLGPGGLFGGQYISNSLRREFPWQHLEALKTDMTFNGPLMQLALHTRAMNGARIRSSCAADFDPS